jgi:hypothetical protein
MNMENVVDYQPATPESVWALLQETDRIVKDTALQMKETDRRMEETDRIVKNTALQMKDTDRRMEVLQKTLGGWAHNQGLFAEEYFFNSFENGKRNFFGEKFDDITKNLKGFQQGMEDEYDIVLYNHSSVALIEVKYKAHENDVPKVLNKAETFRMLFPFYKDYKIYLALASLSFYPELEQECINQGIAIIKQLGDTVIINDSHLKVF